jgi:hypothetical protein
MVIRYVNIGVKIGIICLMTRMVLKGGGNDHEWVGADRVEPLVYLAGFLDGMKPNEQHESAGSVRLTESI